MASKNNHTVIDLFAGCGGLSLGLYQAGWHGVFAIENKHHAAEIFDPDSKWSLAFLFGGTWPFEYFEKTYTVKKNS